jgi:hypothetical protein
MEERTAREQIRRAEDVHRQYRSGLMSVEEANAIMFELLIKWMATLTGWVERVERDAERSPCFGAVVSAV